jgi:hypothetical protein
MRIRRPGRDRVPFGLALLALASCSSEKGTPAPEDQTSPFVRGKTVSTALHVAPGGRWRDPASGLRLVFPQGASGTLTLGPIVEGPARPWSGGDGIYLAYDGDEPVLARMADDAAAYPCLLAYGVPRGSWSDGWRMRWFAVPRVSEAGADSLDFRLPTRPRSGSEACEASLYYWRAALAAGSPEREAFDAEIETARGFLAAWLDSLDEPLRGECRQRMEGARAPVFYPDGSYYAGFFRACGEPPAPLPRIGLGPGASASEIAHQVGHYATHLLTGDATYAALERDAGFDPALGTERLERRGLIEDYARYHEYLLTGSVAGAGDPGDPPAFFASLGAAASPESVDVPSLQGYGVLLMHALCRRDSTMTALTGATITVPVVGLDYTALAGHVIARGASTSGGLRTGAEAYLATLGRADRLPLLAATTGWCYRVGGHVRDRAGRMAPGVEVRGLARIDGRDYPAPGAPVLSDALGAFTAHGIPGGESTLRAAGGADVFDAPSMINWDRLTSTPIGEKELVPWGRLDTMDKLRINLELRFAVSGVDTLLPFVFNQVLTDSQGVFTADRITLDRPFAWDCPLPSDPRGCWVLDSLDIRYDLTTGAVEGLGVRAHDQSGSPTDFALRLRRPLQAVMQTSKRVYFANMQNVDGAQAQGAFTLEMADGAGNRYTEADLRGSDLWIEVRAYCG